MNAIATVMTINLLGMDQMIGQKALNIMEYLDNGANVTEKNVLETWPKVRIYKVKIHYFITFTFYNR